MTRREARLQEQVREQALLLGDALGVLQLVGTYARSRDERGQPLPQALTDAVERQTLQMLPALGL